MGIQGLLPMLKEAQNPDHVKNYKGKTLGIDAYVWLHRGAYAYAQSIALGESNTRYINYAIHRIRMLQHYGVTPYVVFDGGLLSAKKATENDRDRRRKEALAAGKKALQEGKKSLARDYFIKAVDVTPAMAFQLIKALRKDNIRYVVAPFEADAQLAFLEKEGLCDGIITEDSDLLVYGCNLVLFKMDNFGNCVSIARADFARCTTVDMHSWSNKEFRHMAILSGCDYLPSIKGIGLKTAAKLLKKHRTVEQIIDSLHRQGFGNLIQDYLPKFRRADFTFLHQRVFDPASKKLVHLNPLPPHIDASYLEYTGNELPQDIALAIAVGDLDPINLKPFVDFERSDGQKHQSSSKTLLSYFSNMATPKVTRPREGTKRLKKLDANSPTGPVVASNAQTTTSKYFKTPIPPGRKQTIQATVVLNATETSLMNTVVDKATDGLEEEESKWILEEREEKETVAFEQENARLEEDLSEREISISPFRPPHRTSPANSDNITDPDVSSPSTPTAKRKRAHRTVSPADFINSPTASQPLKRRKILCDGSGETSADNISSPILEERSSLVDWSRTAVARGWREKFIAPMSSKVRNVALQPTTQLATPTLSRINNKTRRNDSTIKMSTRPMVRPLDLEIFRHPA